METQPSGQQFLDRLRSDDKSALKELFDLHYLSVCQTIHKFVRDHAQTEDLAQALFIRLWEKRTQLEIESSLAGYLRKMAVNEAVGYLRRKKLHEDESVLEQETTGETVEQEYLQQELTEQVQEAVDALPPRCRTIFQLSRYEQLTYREIADQMDISVKTVENQMGKALKHMREHMGFYLRE